MGARRYSDGGHDGVSIFAGALLLQAFDIPDVEFVIATADEPSVRLDQVQYITAGRRERHAGLAGHDLRGGWSSRRGLVIPTNN